MSRNTSEERLVPSTVQPPRWGDASTFRNPPRELATLKLNPIGGAVGASIRGAEGRIAEALAARDAVPHHRPSAHRDRTGSLDGEQLIPRTDIEAALAVQGQRR